MCTDKGGCSYDLSQPSLLNRQILSLRLDWLLYVFYKFSCMSSQANTQLQTINYQSC